MDDLLSKNALPNQITARKNAIKAYGIGGETLKKYPELWHPEALKPALEAESHPVIAESIDAERLKPAPQAESHPVDTNKLVPNSAAPQWASKSWGDWGVFHRFHPTPNARPSDISEKLVAKMQAWLESGDPILKVEAEQYFAAVSQKESIDLTPDEVKQEQPAGCLIEGVSMPRGFGVSQPKRRGSKTGLKEIQQLNDVAKHSKPEPQPDLAMQAEVEVFFAQYRQENPEELALAWSAGFYNPLAKVDLLAVGARFLDPEEEDWLAIARMIGWLDVEDSLDAIYFTAPPPNFALEQADWYVRPDLTSFLEEPVLLREVIHLHPISLQEIHGAISQRFLQLGWTSRQQKQFMFELFEKPQAELTKDDWEFLLFELESQLQNEI